MPENLSSVEAAESFKMSVQLRAQSKLDNFGERYEQKAEEWIKRAQEAGLEENTNMTPEHIAMTEAAREILVNELYGENIHLEEGRVFHPIRTVGVNSIAIEGPSREGVQEAGEETFEKMDVEGELYVINKLNEDYTPASSYEALALIEE